MYKHHEQSTQVGEWRMLGVREGGGGQSCIRARGLLGD